MRTTSAPLTADMGGMGFIENNNLLCMLSVTINAHLLVAVLERSPRASGRAGCQWFCTSPFGTKSQCQGPSPTLRSEPLHEDLVGLRADLLLHGREHRVKILLQERVYV